MQGHAAPRDGVKWPAVAPSEGANSSRVEFPSWAYVGPKTCTLAEQAYQVPV